MIIINSISKFDHIFDFFLSTFLRCCGHLGRESPIIANTTPRPFKGDGKDIHANSCSSTRKLHYIVPRCTIILYEGRHVSSNVRVRCLFATRTDRKCNECCLYSYLFVLWNSSETFGTKRKSFHRISKIFL